MVAMPGSAQQERPGEDLLALYLDDLSDCTPPEDRAAERALARRAREGDRAARRRLVRSHLRYVMAYVRKYQGQGLALRELIAAGNEGLLEAVDRFDPGRGVKFITYAHWWIRRSVLEALAEESWKVRLPTEQNHRLARLRRAEGELTTQLGRKPRVEELAEAMDLPVREVRRLQGLRRPGLPLDAPAGDEAGEAESYGDRYVGMDRERTEREALDGRRHALLERACRACLTARERRVLLLCYGLDAQPERSLRAIGSALGVSGERVRQLRNRALEKLRDSRWGSVLAKDWETL